MSFYLFINTFDLAKLNTECRVVLQRAGIEIKEISPRDMPSGTASLLVKEKFEEFIRKECEAWLKKHAPDKINGHLKEPSP